MQLKIFRTLWGYSGDYASAFEYACEHGFAGIEGPVPATISEAELFARLLERYQLDYIAEIATTGSYVPDRSLSSDDHMNDLAANLNRLKPLQPLLITCLAGCDAWPLNQSTDFLARAVALAEGYDHQISFETHRGRSLFNPWVTQQIVDALPEIRLTCDFSHWYVVCEGLQESEQAIINNLLKNAEHIHCRVGYAQGPQVPDPRSAVYSEELHQHLDWWGAIWQQHRSTRREYTTATPEFGPDGYDYRDPGTGTTLIEPDMLNRWMAGRLRDEFNDRCPDERSDIRVKD